MSTASLNLSIAVRISRSVRRSSASFWRWFVTFASGITADARMIRIVETISSSMNVKPRRPSRPPHPHRHHLTVTDTGVKSNGTAAPSGLLATPLT